MSDLGFGLGISVIGMGLVFGLLALLWATLEIIGRVDQRIRESEPAAPPLPAEAKVVPTAAELDEMAAIAVAVMLHAEARRRQAAPAMRSTPPGSQIYASRWLAAGRTRQTRGWMGRR